MPPPVSFIDVTSLPFTQTVTVAEAAAGTYGGVANQVWVRFISSAEHFPLGFYATSPGFNILTRWFANDGTTIIDDFSTGTSGWLELDTDTFYFRYTNAVGGAIPNDFELFYDTAPVLSAIPSGAFLINDDTTWPSTYPYPSVPIPATVWIMDGTFLGLADNAMSGELGDSLPDGTILFQNRFSGGGLNELVILDPNLDVVTSFDLFPSVTANQIALCNDGTFFYICDLNTNVVWKITTTGTASIFTTLPFAYFISAIGISRDASTIYFSRGNDDADIGKWDVGSSTETTLYTIPGFVVNTDMIARTGINNFPGEILVQSDNTIVTYWHDFVNGIDHILHIAQDGTLLNDISYDHVTQAIIDHIHYSPYQPDRVYVYFYRNNDSDLGRFADVVLADGTDAQGFNIDLASAGQNLGIDSGIMFSPSVSCFMATLEYGEGPPPPEETTITVVKVTVPSDVTVFDFVATGMDPVEFTLSDGQSQLFSGLIPGTYSVEELTNLGYTTTIEVSNGDEATAITLAEGDTVVVTFTNTLNTEPGGPGSGIYKIQPGKRNDTLWLDTTLGTTEDVKIPNPKIRTGFIGV